jgi:TRAP-type C4-dicarboxylate transport system substrate-binding protein
MINRRHLLQSASIAALGAPALLRAQTAYKHEYRVSLVPGPNTAWYFGAERFMKLVNERTAGRINFKLYPGSTLVQGQQDKELTALRQGVIDVLVGTAVNWSGTVKDLAAFSLPFLMPDGRAVDAILASDALNKDFYDIMRKAGVEPLASGEYGNVQLINSKRRLAKVDDIRGLKMRVVASPLQQEIMNELRANPTSMSFAEAQPALASGAVDGLTLTLEQLVGYKLYTLGLKYVTRWNAYNEFIHFAVANPVWKTWTAGDQQIVRGAARDAARDMTAMVRQAPANKDETLRQLGIDVYTPTGSELNEWRTAVRRVYARWKASINAPLVSRIEEVVANSAKA